MATPLRHSAGLTFGCACPGCGADLEFRDSLWVTTCTHCDSLLRIVMPHGVAAWVARSPRPIAQIRFLIDHYCREHDLTPPGRDLQCKQFYYPYWKVDASLLKVRTRSETRYYPNESNPSADIEESKDIRSVTLAPYTSAFSAGPAADDIPDTLGLRAEYIRLFPFADPHKDASFDVVPVVKTVTAVAERIRKGLSGLDAMEMADPGANTTQLLHPTFSLVYFPYTIVESYSGDARRIVVDGVTGKVISHSLNPAQDVVVNDESPVVTDAQPVFVEVHRCPTCGNPLDNSRSLVYRCDDCDAWTMLGSCAGAVSSVTWREGAVDDTYLPFWGLQIPESDRKEVTRLLGGNREISWLVVPAFAMPNVEAAYRLARRATGSSLITAQLTTIDRPLQFTPVTVEFDRAAALADAVLVRAAVEKQVPLRFTSREPSQVRLFVLPFHLESYFWVDSLLGAVTVERAAVTV